MNLKNDKNGVCPLQVYIYSWVMFRGCFGECFLVWSSEPTTLAPSPCCLFVFVYFGWHLSHSDLNLGHAHTPKSHATLHIRVLQTSAFFFYSQVELNARLSVTVVEKLLKDVFAGPKSEVVKRFVGSALELQNELRKWFR